MLERPFRLVTPFEPTGHQPGAIEALSRGIEQGLPHQTLLGITGSGKTFTVAKVIERINRPVLVLSPNKTLAAQLFAEFKELFPDNAVEYFVSSYDYYQPEAYVARSDTFIEKESQINEQIDRMRHSATRALLERDDVIIVASVSCIYGIGSVETYSRMTLDLKVGAEVESEAEAEASDGTTCTGTQVNRTEERAAGWTDFRGLVTNPLPNPDSADLTDPALHWLWQDMSEAGDAWAALTTLAGGK